MIGVLHDEPKFSESFVAFLLKRNARIEKTRSTSSSIRAKSVWPDFFPCWRISVRKAIRPRSSRISAKRRWPKMIGTTRSRMSFFMNKFRELGFISYNGKIEVHRSLLNAVLYEMPTLERD
jgi:CRP/FNR family transcriptional regulator, cyclic AMP receptor protein